MSAGTTLVTGFEPFAGLTRNPSAEVAAGLDGRTIGGSRVVARILPVSLADYREALAAAIEETGPDVVVAFGLAQGAASIRIERVGVNVADFTIADNDGAVVRSQAIEPAGPPARLATLPVAEIERRLLAAGIPAHVSNSAGAYLCNACLYSLLGHAAGIRGGFVHLPYLPEQAAALMAGRRPEGRPEVASMALETMLRAAEIVVATAGDAGAGG